MSETTAARHQFVGDHGAIVEQTQNWVNQVIVRLNICPFAKAEVQAQTIHYHVQDKVPEQQLVANLLQQCAELDDNSKRATTLFILNIPSLGFYSYLDLLDHAEQMLVEQGYEGIYQLASFHPEYCFGGSESDDAANYTNRAPYPMFHLIREADITKALTTFLRPESIPDRNIEYTRRKGTPHMNNLLMSCYDIDNNLESL